MKKILLFGAGKSATCLIDFLKQEIAIHSWYLTIADQSADMIRSKIDDAPRILGIALDIHHDTSRRELINNSDIVISLLPPSLHQLIASDCVLYRKNLLTASYIDDNIKKLEHDIMDRGLLFLCEMGLDPGIDHMSVMQLAHRIQRQGGTITSFKSHTGGLVAPACDDNPWHYKISWNPRNVVRAGASGAVFKEDGRVKTIAYRDVFEDARRVRIEGLGELAYYPNRDSLSYLGTYRMGNPHTFIRTTLRYPEFCDAWKFVVAAGLTDDQTALQSHSVSFKEWAKSITPFVNDRNAERFRFLGLFDDGPIPASAQTSADVLQHLLEKNLAMEPQDKDMIVMLHELEYASASGKHFLKSRLVVEGANSQRTAMSKTVGLPLGIAASLILRGQISLTGLHVPTLPEIYGPVLSALAEHGVVFVNL